MVRQNPALSFWDRLLKPFRVRDWEACLRQLRPVLDADEDALTPRLLAAGLHLAAGQTVLALLQYETLLPLAVGQGEFFAAIAAQKRLDLLHPAAVTHARRYEVLRRWFISLGRDRRSDAEDSSGELCEAALLRLDDATFTRVMEECAIEGLEPLERVVPGGATSIRLVLYGRATWTLRRGPDIALLEGVAESGQSIAVDTGSDPDTSLVIAPALPTECLVFGPLALAALRGELTGPAAPPGNLAIDTEPSNPAGSAIDPVEAVAEPGMPAAPVERPRPDPRFEPFVALFAPAERRRESRIAISLASGVARFGLENTRVAPITGRLARLAGDSLDLVFMRRDLRHLRTRLEGSCLGLQFNFGPDLPTLSCTGRVRWTTSLGNGPDALELKIEVEFLALRSVDRERLLAAGERYADPPATSGGTRAA